MQLLQLTHTKNKKAGFTLIELLVVIAIIGILAAVVLASLSDARNEGQDASIKQVANNIRTQAELFYNRQGFTYSGVCLDDRVVRLLDELTDLRSETTEVAVDSAGENFRVSCNDNEGGFLILVPVNAPPSEDVDSWCVNHTGFSGYGDSSGLGSTDTVCPPPAPPPMTM